jgi:hypothetical protein
MLKKHKHRVKVNGDKNIVIQKYQYRKISHMVDQFYNEQYIVHGNRTLGTYHKIIIVNKVTWRHTYIMLNCNVSKNQYQIRFQKHMWFSVNYEICRFTKINLFEHML